MLWPIQDQAPSLQKAQGLEHSRSSMEDSFYDTDSDPHLTQEYQTIFLFSCQCWMEREGIFGYK